LTDVNLILDLPVVPKYVTGQFWDHEQYSPPYWLPYSSAQSPVCGHILKPIVLDQGFCCHELCLWASVYDCTYMYVR